MIVLKYLNACLCHVFYPGSPKNAYTHHEINPNFILFNFALETVI